MTNSSPSSSSLGNEFSIDLHALKDWVYSRLWLVIVITLTIESLIGVAGILATKSFRAETLIRMGTIVGSSEAGTRGGVVKRVRQELNFLSVKLEPRPNGSVMITAEGDSPEQAIALTQRASALLLDYDRQAIDSAVTPERGRIASLESSVAQLDAEIHSLTEPKLKNGKNTSTFEEWATAAELRQLLELRNEARNNLIKAKADFVESPPCVLVEPAAQSEPFRPRWPRNFVLGAIFGLVFGLFVVGLMGIFRQLGEQMRQ